MVGVAADVHGAIAAFNAGCGLGAMDACASLAQLGLELPLAEADRSMALSTLAPTPVETP